MDFGQTKIEERNSSSRNKNFVRRWQLRRGGMRLATILCLLLLVCCGNLLFRSRDSGNKITSLSVAHKLWAVYFNFPTRPFLSSHPIGLLSRPLELARTFVAKLCGSILTRLTVTEELNES